MVTDVLSQVRLQRGNLLLKRGKLDEAESDFKKVVSNFQLIKKINHPEQLVL